MKSFGVLLFFLCIVTFSFGQENLISKLYVGTFTSEGAEGIYLCSFSHETGKISLENTFKAIDNPSFLKISSDQKYLYAVTRASSNIEPSGGFISAYEIGVRGNLKFLNKQISNGLDPCHVDVSSDGRFVGIATYGGGTTSLYEVNKDGSLKPASSVIINQGLGPNNDRQAAPHAHSIKFSPWDNQVFSADLGTDQLNIFYLEGNQLVQHGQTFMKLEPGAGPRHFDFSKTGKVVFVINELNSTITSFELNEGKWLMKQTISTLPEDFNGTSYCADIHVSNDGKFLYGSNRGHNSIAVFNIDDSNKLNVVGFVSVEGDWPRNFTLTADGNHMLVANQKSGNIAVFKVNRNTGMLEFTGNEIKLPSPVCLEFL